MSADQIYTSVIVRALKEYVPDHMNTKPAHVMLVAIGLQESRFEARAQILQGGGKGPARGFWQFERGGGCRGVLMHEASHVLMVKTCLARACAPTPADLWRRLEVDDVLACVAARLLLFTDPKPLPNNAQGGWDYYTRVWRPGKPHRHTWDDLYAQAVNIVNAQEL